jgi:hypothetical protein
MSRFLVGKIIQTVTISNCGAHAQIRVRKYIGTPQRENQGHLRCPATDSLDLGQDINNLRVRQSPDLPKVHRPVIHLRLQVGQITRFLRRQSDGPKLGQAESGKIRRRYSIGAEKLHEPSPDRMSGLGRDLLGNDGTNQYAKSIALTSHCAWPHRIDHRPHDRVGFAQMTTGSLLVLGLQCSISSVHVNTVVRIELDALFQQ